MIVLGDVTDAHEWGCRLREGRRPEGAGQWRREEAGSGEKDDGKGRRLGQRQGRKTTIEGGGWVGSTGEKDGGTERGERVGEGRRNERKLEGMHNSPVTHYTEAAASDG